jgi:hypothetical protein
VRSTLRYRIKHSRRLQMMLREMQTRGRDCEGRCRTALSLPSMTLLWKSAVLPLQTALTRHRSITGMAFMPSAYKTPFSQTTRFAFCPRSTRALHTILRRSGQPPCTLTCSKQSMEECCRSRRLWPRTTRTATHRPVAVSSPLSLALASVQDSFNYFLPSLRNMVEQTFGVVVARWGILWSPLRCSLAQASKISAVCCKIHYYIIGQRDKAGDHRRSSQRSGGRPEQPHPRAGPGVCARRSTPRFRSESARATRTRSRR